MIPGSSWADCDCVLQIRSGDKRDAKTDNKLCRSLTLVFHSFQVSMCATNAVGDKTKLGHKFEIALWESSLVCRIYTYI